MRDLRSIPALFAIALLFLSGNCNAQCMSVPLTLKQRIKNSAKIVKGIVREQVPYKDNDGNIYTLNKIEVSAYLKGYSPKVNIGVITIGGHLGNEMQISYPSLKLYTGQEYVFLLRQNEHMHDNKKISSTNPDLIQSMPYGDMQGAIIFQAGKYIDAFIHYSADEKTFFKDIFQYAHETARKPDGSLYNPAISDDPSIVTTSITSFSPTTTNAGTVVAGDQVTITGTGFGSIAGDVFFTNADDGGASYISSGITSDIISWSDNSITVKVPDGAGTGPVNVNGIATSASSLNIGYAHASVASDFAGFASLYRQSYYLRDMNGYGGYTYLLNSPSGFSSNAPAVAAFSRALHSWTCNTFINWDIGGNTTDGFADDGTSSVLFDNTLPAGVLARANSRFMGGAMVGCDGVNTVWWLTEVDIQVLPDPPVLGYAWQYGPGMPAANEYDLETVLLHELGHAHGLGHRIAPGEIMDYALFNGTAIRTPDATDINGGVNKLSYSTVATCFDPPGSGSFMTALNISNCGSSLTLPVELIYFDAKKAADNILVEWTTASETNSYYYIVERSRDGRHFEEVGRLNGSGNSNIILNYSFMDTGPYEGVSYYRLKQTNFDGSFFYSQIKAVTFESEKKYFIQIQPNPAREKIILLFNPKNEKEGVLNIYDVNGKSVYTEKILLEEGMNNREIDISTFAKGVYFVEFNSENNSYRNKLIKD